MERGGMWKVLAALALLIGASGCDLLMGPAQHISRGEGLLKKGALSSASIEFKKALQSDPGNWKARLLLAKADLEQGDFPAAVADLDKVDSAHERDPAVIATRWRLKLLQGKATEVLQALSAPNTGLRESDRLCLMADAALMVDRPTDAEQYLRQALRTDPSNQELTVLMGTVLLRTQGADAAASFLEKAHSAEPDSLQIVRAYADALQRSGRFKEAERQFRAAINLIAAKENPGGYLTVVGGLVESLLAQKQTVSAEKLTEQMFLFAPNARQTLMARAQVAEARKDYGGALENLERILNAEPDNPALRTLVASVNMERGNLEQAGYHLQQVLRKNPGFSRARRMLAQVYLAQGRSADASKVLSDSGGGDSSPNLRLLQARALLGSGDRAKAIAVLAAIEPELGVDANLREDVAATYLQAGKPDDAIRLLSSSRSASSFRDDQLRLLALVARDRVDGVQELLKYAKANTEHFAELRFATSQLLALGRGQDAEALIATYVDSHPKDVAGLGALAEAQAKLGRLDDAGATLKRSLAIQPTVDIRVALARLSLARGQEAEAVQWLEQARDADLKSKVPRDLLARIFLKRQKLESAQKLVDELLAIDANQAESYILAASVAGARHDVPAALKAMNDAVRVEPTSVRAWLSKAQLHERLKQGDEAISAYRRAQRLAPASMDALSGIARLEIAAGRTAAAFEAARQAQSRDDSRPAGLAVEGELLLASGKAAEAEKVFQTLQDLAPSSAGAVMLFRARAKAGEKAPEVVLVDWLRERPTDTFVRVALAEYWTQSGAPSKAIAEYEAAQKASPSSAEIANNLAWAYQRAGDRRALATAQRAYELAPSAASVADTLGWILLSEGKPDALKYLRIAAGGAPQSAEIQYHLAKALVTSGATAEAQGVAAPFMTKDASPEWRQKFSALFPR